MLPPDEMLAIKKLQPIRCFQTAVLGMALWLAGCAPAGPRALLQGDRLVREGKYREAIGKLETATRLLPQDARAWNCLGMAYHGAGEASRALEAYQRALALDRNNLVFVAHYNLGCLYLEQGDAAAAVTELRSYCFLSNTLPALLKLGEAELGAREWEAAERTFSSALRLDENEPAAWNGLGLACAQRQRVREAVQHFQTALKNNPEFAPAWLNMAVIYHRSPQKVYALDMYRSYLALDPRPAQWADAQAALRQLEKEVAAPSPALTNTALAGAKTNQVAPPSRTTETGTVAIATSAPPSVSTERTLTVATTAPPRAVTNLALARTTAPPVTVTSSAPVTTVVATSEVVQTIVTNVVRPGAVEPATMPRPAPETAAPPVLAEVKLPGEGIIAPAQEILVAPSEPSSAVEVPSGASNGWVVQAPPPPTEKRSFLARLNPFRSKPQPLPPPTVVADPPPERAGQRPETVAAPVAPPPSLPRYEYLSPSPPAAGDTAAAEALLQRGFQLHQLGETQEAAKSYRAAVAKDPACYEAHYNLGLLAFAAADWPGALRSFETALAIKPEAVNARLNLGLALERARFPRDAAHELDQVIRAKPEEVRAHLTLGNLYAQHLGQPARAREHYGKVLELDPRHPQSSAIRYWLAANP